MSCIAIIAESVSSLVLALLSFAAASCTASSSAVMPRCQRSMSATVSGAVVGLVDGAGPAAGAGASATLSAGSAASGRVGAGRVLPSAGDEQCADHGDGSARKTIGVHAGLGTNR